MNGLTAFLARWLIKVPHVALANLLTKTPVVPELLQQDCTAAAIVREIGNLLHDPECRSRQLAALTDVQQTIEVAGAAPSTRAAQLVLDYLADGRPPAP